MFLCIINVMCKYFLLLRHFTNEVLALFVHWYSSLNWDHDSYDPETPHRSKLACIECTKQATQKCWKCVYVGWNQFKLLSFYISKYHGSSQFRIYLYWLQQNSPRSMLGQQWTRCFWRWHFGGTVFTFGRYFMLGFKTLALLMPCLIVCIGSKQQRHSADIAWTSRPCYLLEVYRKR